MYQQWNIFKIKLFVSVTWWRLPPPSSPWDSFASEAQPIRAAWWYFYMMLPSSCWKCCSLTRTQRKRQEELKQKAALKGPGLPTRRWLLMTPALKLWNPQWVFCGVTESEPPWDKWVICLSIVRKRWPLLFFCRWRCRAKCRGGQSFWSVGHNGLQNLTEESRAAADGWSVLLSHL